MSVLCNPFFFLSLSEVLPDSALVHLSGAIAGHVANNSHLGSC